MRLHDFTVRFHEYERMKIWIAALVSLPRDSETQNPVHPENPDSDVLNILTTTHPVTA